MPSVEYTTEIMAPIEAVWEFVSDMDNWAHFVVGYQKHEQIDEAQSLWTVKGDMGVLVRVVDVRVEITEWIPEKSVEFRIAGVTEQVTGTGSFKLSPAGADQEAVRPISRPSPPVRLWRWLRGGFGRILWRLLSRKSRDEVKEVKVDNDRSGRQPADSPPPGLGGAGSRIAMRLELKAGGPMAPMVDALMGPMLEPAAADLAAEIRRQLEG